MAILKLNNNSLTSVTELPSGVGSDPNTKVSLARLGLRVFANQNLATSNTQNLSYDVFQDSTGITNLTNVTRNASEYISSIDLSEAYETGDRTSSYSITFGSLVNSDFATGSSSVSNWLDGNKATGASNGWYWASAGSNLDGASITFDLGSGNSKIYTGAKIYQNNSSLDDSGSAPSSGNWKWRGSNDQASWTDLSSNFVWDGGTAMITYDTLYYREVTWSNTTAYRYIQILGVSGAQTTSNPWQTELEFKVRTGSENASGSFEGVDVTAPSSVSKMGAVITYEETGTNVLNTDIVMKLSADSGSNFTTATLEALPDFASGVKCAKISDVSVTPGTACTYQINFANQSSSKEAKITGVALTF